MRFFLASLTGCLLCVTAGYALASPPTAQQRQVCTWGAGVAAEAQQAKLAGRTLYAHRKRLQARKFQKPWMRMTAMGITEQTYGSRSRLGPAAIKQTYYEQCVVHAAQGKR